MTRATLWITCALAGAAPALAQHVSIGPTLVVGDYREVSSRLEYGGVGAGATGAVTFGPVTIEGAFSSVRMKPSGSSGATESFTATEVAGRLRWDVTGYLGFEAGLTKRSASSEFAAQSVGAATLGARVRYLLGPAGTVWARGSYLAAAKFSGGGSAPLSLELGLGVEVAPSPHFHLAVSYALQSLDRKTRPGGGAEVSAPIEQALGRVGVAVGF